MRQIDMQDRLLDGAVSILEGSDPAPLTVRSITAAAGVNVATVTTAFGGRGPLLDALLVRALIPVNHERDRLFAELGSAATIEEVVHAFVEPLRSLQAGQSPLALRVIAAVISDSGTDGRSLDRVLLEPGVTRFADELQSRGLVSVDDVDFRVRLGVGTILSAFAMSSYSGAEDVSGRGGVVQFVAAGLGGG